MRSDLAPERAPASLFPAFPEAAAAYGKDLVLTAGEHARLPGDDLATVVYVREGAVKLVGHVGADREQIVAFGFSGDMVSFSLTPESTYSLWSITPSSLLAIPAARMIEAAAGDSDLLQALFARTVRMIERSRAKAVMLGRKTAQERLATFLCAMGDRIGRQTGSTVAITLPMSRREIADSLGITIETVSRQLTELRELGVVETQGRSEVRVLDMARLHRLAAFS